MATRTTLLDEALEAWKFTRDGVVDELRNLPDKDLAFRPAEKSRSALELVQHIIESGLMMAGELSRPDGDFRASRTRGSCTSTGAASRAGGRRPRSSRRCARRTGMERRSSGSAGELHMLQHIRRFDGEMGTRLAWMNHGISHEEYHRGQLALYARLLGRVPALTKKILGG